MSRVSARSLSRAFTLPSCAAPAANARLCASGGGGGGGGGGRGGGGGGGHITRGSVIGNIPRLVSLIGAMMHRLPISREFSIFGCDAHIAYMYVPAWMMQILAW